MGCAKWGSQGMAVIGPIGPRRNNFLMPLIQLGLFRLDFLRLSSPTWVSQARAQQMVSSARQATWSVLCCGVCPQHV